MGREGILTPPLGTPGPPHSRYLVLEGIMIPYPETIRHNSTHFASEICESHCGSRRRRDRRRRRGSSVGSRGGGARSRGPGRSRGCRGCRGCRGRRGPTSPGRGTLGRSFDSLTNDVSMCFDLKSGKQN